MLTLTCLHCCSRSQVNIIAVVGNDAGWTQIEREQVPMLGDNVACQLEYTPYNDGACVSPVPTCGSCVGDGVWTGC